MAGRFVSVATLDTWISNILWILAKVTRDTGVKELPEESVSVKRGKGQLAGS